MTREEWDTTDDGLEMLLWFRRSWLGNRSDRDRLTQRYFLACCRKIWRLLPDEYSRRAIKVAERHNVGRATRKEWRDAVREAEAGWIYFQEVKTGLSLAEEENPEQLGRWIGEIASIPAEELRGMVRPRSSGEAYSPGELLELASGFVEFSVESYGGWGERAWELHRHQLDEYQMFLSAPLLREIVGHRVRTG